MRKIANYLIWYQFVACVLNLSDSFFFIILSVYLWMSDRRHLYNNNISPKIPQLDAITETIRKNYKHKENIN